MNNNAFRAAAAGLVLAFPAWVHASGQVTGVKVTRLSSGIEVLVTGEGLSRPKEIPMIAGKKLRLEFTAPLKGKSMKANTGFDMVPTVAIAGWAKSPKTHVDIDLVSAKTALSPDGKGGWKIAITSKTAKPSNVALQPIFSGAKATATKPMQPLATGFPVAPQKSSHVAAAIGEKAAPKTFVKNEPQVHQPKPNVLAAATGKKAEPKTTSKPATPKSGSTGKARPMVALDFVDTDIVQVFRALARQTDTNIVTSEEVAKKGRVTISLHDVNVDQAMNLLCSVSGLRATQMDGTFVVTSKEKYQETARLANEAAGMETRVVPLYSGEGQQVKAALLKAVAGDTANGRFEVFLPSEELAYKQTQDVTPDGKLDPNTDAASLTVSTKGKASDGYLVVVGNPSRLDEITGLAEKIDGQICGALGKERPGTPMKFTKIYNVNGARATDLVTAIAGINQTKIGNVSLLATPAGSIARQAIVLNGRQDEVMAVYSSLEQLDSNDSAAPVFTTVELSFSDPRSMREMLLSNVPGLAVTIPPASVGNPRLYMRDDTRKQAEERGTQLPAPQGGGTPLATGNQNNQNLQNNNMQKDVNVGSDNAGMQGLTQPYKDFESLAFPMRLVLRGTQEQVDRGMNFIRALDVAPKHVAIEMRVMELNREEALRAGIDFNLSSGGAVRFLRFNNSQDNPANSGGLSLGSAGTPFDVTASLDKIANKNNLISRPNSIALDGRETELFVGDVIRYIKSIISSQNGVSVETDEVRVGVRMAVLPRVGGDGSITMDLRPAVSFLRGFDTISQIGGKLPQTSERVAQSSFNMKSGETIAISGLITDQDRKQVQGLPFLMDLPIVGQLFRKTTNERVRSELVLFVTARTIEGPLGGERQTLPAQNEMPAHQGFAGPESTDMASRSKAGSKESKKSGPGQPVAPEPSKPPKNG